MIRHANRNLVISVLVAVFLLQPVLVYLVTPLVAHDANGEQVVICTLQGEKVVDVVFPGSPVEEDLNHCPALQLFQLVGAAQLPVLPPMPMVGLFSVELLNDAADPFLTHFGFTAYSTRAPPIS